MSGKQRKRVRACDEYLLAKTDVAAEWEDAYTHLRKSLGLPEDEPVPALPRPSAPATLSVTESNGVTAPSDSKRKAPEEDEDVTMESDVSPGDLVKKAKTNGAPQSNGTVAAVSPEETTLAHVKATIAYIPFLSPEHLMPPKMPSHDEMEAFLLDLRKKALVEEYFGEEQAAEA